jgi:hypothetical protein
MPSLTIATRNNGTDYNDMYLDQGNIAMAFDIEALVQICRQVCQVRLGEVVLDTIAGLPFFETVFNGSPNIQQFETALTIALSNVPGVTQVQSVTVTVNGNILNYVAVILTIYGGTVING